MVRAASPGSRSAGLLPLLAGVTSALALTGAAVYTVDQARCEPGEYIRHADHVELTGSCVDGADLREAGTERHSDHHGPDIPRFPQDDDGNYRP